MVAIVVFGLLLIVFGVIMVFGGVLEDDYGAAFFGLLLMIGGIVLLGILSSSVDSNCVEIESHIEVINDQAFLYTTTQCQDDDGDIYEETSIDEVELFDDSQFVGNR